MPMWLGAEFVKSAWHDVYLEKGFLGENSALDLAPAINIQSAEVGKILERNFKSVSGKNIRSSSH